MLLQVDQNIAFYPFLAGELIVRPCGVIHKIIYLFLQGFKNLPVGPLDLT